MEKDTPPLCCIVYNAAREQDVTEIKKIFNNLKTDTKFDQYDVEIINEDLDLINDEANRSEIKAYFASILKEKFNYQEPSESEKIYSIDSIEADANDDEVSWKYPTISSEDLRLRFLSAKNDPAAQKNVLTDIVNKKITMPDEIDLAKTFGNIFLILQSCKHSELQTLLMQYIFTNSKNFEFYSVVGFPEGIPNKRESILGLLNNDVKKNLKEQIAKFIANIINDDIDFSFHKLKILLQNIKDKQLIAKIYSKLHLRQFANKTLNDFKFALELWPQDLGREYSAEIQDVLRLFKKPTTDYKQKSPNQLNLILWQKNNAGDSSIDIPDIYYENEFNYIEEKVKKISKICQDYIDHLQKAAGEIADSKRKIVEKLNKILLDAQNKVSTITDNRSKLEILKPSLSEFIKALQDEDKKELTKCRDTAWTRFFKYIMALFMSFSYGWTGSKNRLFGPERTTGYKFVKTLNDNIKAL